MSRILIITGLLPVSAIGFKKNENDILLVTEDQITSKYSNISFKYIFTFPYANRILSKISKKWDSYYNLKKVEVFELRGRNLFLLPVFVLPKKVMIRNVLTSLSLFVHRKRIERLIRDFKPTVLHAQDADTGAFIARILSKKYNIPYIVTLRELNKVKDKKIKKNLEYANNLIAISPTQQKMLGTLIDKSSILIPHGINDVFFQERKNDYNVDGRLGNGIKLVTIARLLDWKNIDLIIKQVLVNNDLSLDIIGSGPENQNLKSLVQRSNLEDRVRFLGQISQERIADVISECHLFVLISYPETLGRVYFEVMALGLPVIASKNTGVDGIITDGVEGFLIDHKSDHELESVLKKITENPSIISEMGLNAKKLAKKYDWNEVSKKYYDIYNEQ